MLLYVSCKDRTKEILSKNRFPLDLSIKTLRGYATSYVYALYFTASHNYHPFTRYGKLGKEEFFLLLPIIALKYPAKTRKSVLFR